MTETSAKATKSTPDQRKLLQGALVQIKELRKRLQVAKDVENEPIAIVGMGCRFPGGADTPEAYWQLLRNGVDAITEMPSGLSTGTSTRTSTRTPTVRWDVNRYYDPTPGVSGKTYVRQAGYLQDIENFDAAFFGISPREANSMDPQQRLLLEVAWEALEQAGQSPSALRGSQTGVFIGIGQNDYANLRLNLDQIDQIDIHDGTGNGYCYAAGRLSYIFGLQGPAVALDTACSSSLVAIHQACQSLRNRECDLAMAGGVKLMLSPVAPIYLAQMKALASDGRCKAFDAAANGFSQGEGCGLIVLKRQSDALAQGDEILALIRGSATNHDGASSGFTVPNGLAQAALIRRAQQNAGAEPHDMAYIEAHGTGTKLGDPIEVEALGQIFGDPHSGNQDNEPLLIGSVKTNLGHLEAAAGIAGLIKVVLALQHGEIPPQLHFQSPNPSIAWDQLPIKVVTEPTPWPNQRSMAGISSFGMSGTNAHIVLERAPEPVPPVASAPRPCHTLTLSAKDGPALHALTERYRQFIDQNPAADIGALCHTTNIGRAHFRHRLAIVTESIASVSEQLAFAQIDHASDQPTGGIYQGERGRNQRPHIAFMFTGQGSQYVNMGRQLYDIQPLFRQTLDHCDAVLRPFLGHSILAVMFETTNGSGPQANLFQTAYTQPALFVLEYALAKLWQSWGIQPDALIGHSIGELVAACVADVFSLEDGLKLVATRGSLMQALPTGGSMAAIFTDGATLAPYMAPYTSQASIAAYNGPRNSVISGEKGAIEHLVATLQAAGIKSRPLQVSHAFHSPLMEPMLDEFEEQLGEITFQAPKLPLISNLTGRCLADNEVPDARYWRRHVREGVQFIQGVQSLLAQECDFCLELGPKPILSNLVKQYLGRQEVEDVACYPSLAQGQGEWETMSNSVAALYVAGAEIDWHGFAGDDQPHRMALPTYPFQRKRYWIPEHEINHQQPAQGQDNLAFANTSAVAANMKTSDIEMNERNNSGQKSIELAESLQTIFATTLQLEPSDVALDVPLIEMGADSMMLADAVRRMEKTYDLDIEVHRLYDELSTIAALTVYINEYRPSANIASPVEPLVPQVAVDHVVRPSESGNSDAIERVINQQLEVMSQQLALLQGDAPSQLKISTQRESQAQSKEPRPQKTRPAAKKSLAQDGLSTRQQHHLHDLIRRYTARTPKSKALAQQYRQALANSRASAGFRPSIKEMLYPISGHTARGARMWDIDGNEYVDISMGFGVHLFGHAPAFLTEAVEQQINTGIQIGPQAALAGETAQLFCELTGMDRVTFCNSGTEAVMTAIRLARAATGRSKVVRFSGAYHGHIDGMMAGAADGNQLPEGVPSALGIPPSAVEDTLVLAFDDPDSLTIIRERAHELAAVITSPVQSYHPDVQPRAFLQELRQITQAADVALISDEVLMGFRVHPGPTHTWLGMEADIATYGKLVGGGMPIGVVAGRNRFMNYIDGGHWQYGDDSYPTSATTFFAGTFNKNPLTMATSLAVLQQIKERGATLYGPLIARTERLATTLNDYFETQNVPIQISHFGTMFRFVFRGNMDLFFYHLVEKGVYVWEGRTCFLSTAHTDEDVDYVVRAVQASVEALQAGGFLSVTSEKSSANRQTSPDLAAPISVPLSEEQQALWALADDGDQSQWQIQVNLGIRGPLHVDALAGAVEQLVARHEALRTVMTPDGSAQVVLPLLQIPVEQHDLLHSSDVALETSFNLTEGPLMRVQLLKLAEAHHQLVLTTHHIISDGWSIGLMMAELAALYAKKSSILPRPTPYRHFIQAQIEQRETEAVTAHEAYWLAQFDDCFPVAQLPRTQEPLVGHTHRGQRYSVQLDGAFLAEIKQAGQAAGCTLSMTLLSAYALLLHHLTQQDDLVIGVPTSGRTWGQSKEVVGYCTHLMPIRSRLPGDATFASHMAAIKKNMLAATRHQDYPFARLLKELSAAHGSRPFPALTTIFNLDQPVPDIAFQGLSVEVLPANTQFALVDFRLDVMEVDGTLWLDYDYKADCWDRDSIARWHQKLAQYLQGLVTDPAQIVAELQHGEIRNVTQ